MAARTPSQARASSSPPVSARAVARSLTPAERARYRRHLLLPEFGEAGQERLLSARVLLVGLGGLGCPIAQYLAAAGVGTLGLVDADEVEPSNLQRQILYGPADVGRPKVEVARARLAAQNPDVAVEPHPVRLRAANAEALLSQYDLVVDGSDNFPTRYLVNDACVRLGLPNVSGAILRFEGQVTVFAPGDGGPCYRCLHPAPPDPGSVPSCSEAGVLGVLPGLVALVQATEAVKLLTGLGEPLVGRLLLYDALGMSFSEFRLERDPGCPVCGDAPTLTGLEDVEVVCGSTEGGGMGGPTGVPERSVSELAELRARGEELLLLDVREPDEWEIARIDGALLVPLSELERRLEELAGWRDRRVVVHCHHGGRSAHACKLLRQHGFDHAENLQGGIDAWSREVDESVPRY